MYTGLVINKMLWFHEAVIAPRATYLDGKGHLGPFHSFTVWSTTDLADEFPDGSRSDAGMVFSVDHDNGADRTTSQAVDLLKSAIDKNVTNRYSYFYLGAFYRELKMYEDALATFAAGTVQYPHDEEFLFQMGVTYESMGNLEKAADKLRETIQFNPNHAEARNYLAYIFAEEDMNLEEALNHIQLALSLKENNAAFIDTLGWIYFKMGRYMDAVRELEKAIQLMDPPEAVILDHLGDAYIKVGSKELALKRWKESLELDPTNEQLQKKILAFETGAFESKDWVNNTVFYTLEYTTIFGTTIRIFIASITAFLIAQLHDVWAFNFWRQKTKGRYLWLRNNLSTIVSTFIDTTLFMFIAFYALTDKFTVIYLFQLIVPYWLIKVLFALFDTPFCYLGVRWLRSSKTNK